MTNGRETVVLVSSADVRYARPLAVMLASATRNLSPEADLTVYVFDGGLTRRCKRRIERSIDNPNATIVYLRPSTQELQGVPVFGHISLSTYFRLLMPKLLPAEVSKAIYVDADCVVIGDLMKLWCTAMKGRPLLAAPAINPGQWAPDQVAAAERRADYLNAGVLVMDLDMWRREELAQDVVTYLVENSDCVKHWDQDGINHVLHDRWGRLPIKWNYRVDCGVPPRPGRDTTEDLRAHAAIVHYASSAKPWDYGCDHPSRDLFFEHTEQTEWAGWRPRPPVHVLVNRHYWGSKARKLPVLARLLDLRKGAGRRTAR